MWTITAIIISLLLLHRFVVIRYQSLIRHIHTKALPHNPAHLPELHIDQVLWVLTNYKKDKRRMPILHPDHLTLQMALYHTEAVQSVVAISTLLQLDAVHGIVLVHPVR